MDEEQLQLLWDSHAKNVGFKDIGEFKSLMQDDNARKVYFDESNKTLGFKDYNEFNLILKKKSGTQSLPQDGQQDSQTTSSQEPNYAQLQFNNFVKGLEQEGIKKVEAYKTTQGIVAPDQKVVNENAQKAWDETQQQLLPPLQKNYDTWEKDRLGYYQEKVNQGANPDELNKQFKDEQLLAHENFINKPLSAANEQFNKQYKSPEIEEYNNKLKEVEKFAKQVDAEINKKADDRIKTVQNFNEQLAKFEERALTRQYPVVGQLKDEFTKSVDKLKDQSNLRIEDFKSENPNASEYEIKQFAEKEKKKLDEAIEPQYQKYRGAISQIQRDPDFAKGFTESYKNEIKSSAPRGSSPIAPLPEIPQVTAFLKSVVSMLGDTFLGGQASGLAGSMSTDFDQNLLSTRGWREEETTRRVSKEDAKREYIKRVGQEQYDKEKQEFIDRITATKEELSKFSKKQEGEAAGYLHQLPATWEEAKQKGALGISEYISKNTGGVVGLAAPAVAASLINPYLGVAIMGQSAVAIEKGEAFNKGIEMLEENTGLSRKELYEKDLDSLLRDTSTQSGLINGTMEFVSELTMIGKFLPKGTLPKMLSRVLKNAAIQIPASTLIEGSTEWAQAIDTDYAALKGQVDKDGNPIYTHDQIMGILNKNIDEGAYDEDFIGGVTGAMGMSGIGGVRSGVRGQIRRERLQKIKAERSRRVTPTPQEAPVAAQQPAATAVTPQTEPVVAQQIEQMDEAKLTTPEVKAQRNEIKETIHSVAEEAGIDINTPEFKAASKEITGKSHLDKMNTRHLGQMLQYVQGEKEVSEGTTLFNEFLQDEELQKQPGKTGGEGTISEAQTQENIQTQEEEKLTTNQYGKETKTSEATKAGEVLKEEPEAAAGMKSAAIVETPKGKIYGSQEKTRSGEETQKVITKTGEAKVSPVSKTEMKSIVASLPQDVSDVHFRYGISPDETPKSFINKLRRAVGADQAIKLLNANKEKRISPVKKRTNRPQPLTKEAKQVVLEYDEEARNPSIPESDRRIAEALTGVKVDRSSIVNTIGDKNAITPALAKSYTKKGGVNIDQIAAQVSETLGQEVTPEQVWQFMKDYPQGPKTISTPSGNTKLQEIVNRYVDITGKGLNQKTARDMINRPDFYEGLSEDLDKSGLKEDQIDEVEKEIYQEGAEVATNEEDAIDTIINQYKKDGVIDWVAIQKALDDPFENESISQLTKELYGKLEERTQQGIRQTDLQSNVAEQSKEAKQRGLAERIRGAIRSLRSAKSEQEKVKIATQIKADTGKYLLNRQGVITGTDASFADKNSSTFFDLIDEGKSVYLMDEDSKIAETKEDYEKINAKLKDKVTIVNGSMIFDEAFSNGAIKAAKELGYDSLRLTEIDGTNSTLQILNFDKLTHIIGEDFVSKAQQTKSEKANDLLAEGFSDLADAIGAKKNITGSKAKAIEGLIKIGHGLIIKGEATIDNVIDKIKAFLKSKGVTLSEVELKEIKTEIKKLLSPKKKKKTQGSKKGGTKPRTLIPHLVFAKEKILEIYGPNYKPRSHDEAHDLTKKFVKEMGGIDNAYSVIETDPNIVGADVRSLIRVEKLEKLKGEMETNPDAEAEFAKIMGIMMDVNLDQGRGGAIMDYIYNNFGSMFKATKQIGDYKKITGGYISPELEEQFKQWGKQLEEQDKIIKKQQDEIDALKTNFSLHDIEEAIKRESILQKGKDKIKKAREDRSSLQKEWAKTLRGGSLQASIIPGLTNEQLVIAVKIAKTYLDEFGGNVDLAIAKTKELLKVAFSDENIENLRNQLEESFTFEGFKIPQKMLLNLFKEGYNTPETLVAKVLEILQKTYPTIGEQQVKDIISGYGETINPPEGTLVAKLGKVKRLIRLNRALDDLRNKLRPLKSGPQRATIEEDERALMREIRNLLKDLPIDEVTSSKQLKTSLDAAKARAENRIQDLKKAIKDHKEILLNKNKVTDAELEELKKERAYEQKRYDDTFNTPEKKEAEKIKRHVESLTDAINRAIKKLESNSIEIDTAKKDKVSSDKIKELEEVLKSTKQALEFLRKEMGIAELARLDHLIENAKLLEEKYLLKIKTKDFSPRKVRLDYDGYDLNDTYARLEKLKQDLKVDRPAKDKAEIQKKIDQTIKFIDKVKENQKAIISRNEIKEQFAKEKFKAEMEQQNKLLRSLYELTTGVPRQLNANFEFSIAGVQFFFPTLNILREDMFRLAKATNPFGRYTFKDFRAESRTGKNFGQMFKSWASDEAHKEYMGKLKSSVYYQQAKKIKLAVREEGGKAAANEEGLQSNWVGKFFGAIGKGLEKIGLKALKGNLSYKFERAIHAYANMIRMQAYILGSEKIRKEGKNFIEHQDEYKALASAINTATASPSMGRLDANSELLNVFLYSAKLLYATAQEVSPLALWHMHTLHTKHDKPTVTVFGKKMPGYKVSVAQQYALYNVLGGFATAITTGLLFTALMKSMSDDDEDWEYELDPRSSHAFQIRKKGKDGRVTYIGTVASRYYSMIGLQAKLWPVMFGGGVKNKNTGEIQIPGQRGGRQSSVPTRKDLVVNFIGNKAAPIPGYVISAYGVTYKYDNELKSWEPYQYGKEFDYSDQLAEKIYPMYAGTIYDLAKYQNPGFAAFGIGFSAFGIPFNTYDESGKQKTTKKFKTD